MTAPLTDSGVNDQLVNLRPVDDQTCFAFLEASYPGVVKLLQHTPDAVVDHVKGRVERIFFFASFKLPLFNEYEMVFIIA